MDNSLMMAGLIFVLVMLMGLLSFSYSNFYKKKKDLRERIRKEAEDPNSKQSEPKKKTLLLKVMGRIGEQVRLRSGTDFSEIKRRLLRAGFYEEKGPMVFFGFKIFLVMLFLVIFTALKFFVLKGLAAEQVLILIVFFTVAGFYLPDFYLYQRTRTRKRKLFEGFPDALDLLVVCVEAGMGLDAAIKRVGDEIAIRSKVLSDEFRLMSLEIQMGKSRGDALRNLAMRTDLENVSGLVSILVQTDKFGTRVAQALRIHSDSMRAERYLRAEEVAAKLPVKLVFPLIFFIFPSLFVTIAGPAFIRIFRVLIT